jgi:hypothetical protein
MSTIDELKKLMAERTDLSRLEKLRLLSSVFTGPKSVCQCAHLGDGPRSNHADSALAKGHGWCLVANCSCTKFTWSHHTEAWKAAADEVKS